MLTKFKIFHPLKNEDHWYSRDIEKMSLLVFFCPQEHNRSNSSGFHTFYKFPVHTAVQLSNPSQNQTVRLFPRRKQAEYIENLPIISEHTPYRKIPNWDNFKQKLPTKQQVPEANRLIASKPIIFWILLRRKTFSQLFPSQKQMDYLIADRSLSSFDLGLIYSITSKLQVQIILTNYFQYVKSKKPSVQRLIRQIVIKPKANQLIVSKQ